MGIYRSSSSKRRSIIAALSSSIPPSLPSASKGLIIFYMSAIPKATSVPLESTYPPRP
jgi:hypothetical protein